MNEPQDAPDEVIYGIRAIRSRMANPTPVDLFASRACLMGLGWSVVAFVYCVFG